MKRTLAMLLAVLMLFSLLPAQVFAEETVPVETTSQETEAAETTEETAAETTAEETAETVAETAAAETEAAVETVPEETTETAAETEPAQTEEAVAEETTEAAEEEPAETIQETLPEVYLEVSDEAMDAISYSNYEVKINEFINDGRWKHGTWWGSGCRPKLSNWDSAECCAYVADFAAYVYGCYGNIRPQYCADFTAFYNPAEIRTGDIIHYNRTDDYWGHWFVVLKRDGNKLYVAEGNVDGKVRISDNVRYIENGQLRNTSNSNWENTITAFDGYHYNKFIDDLEAVAYKNQCTRYPTYGIIKVSKSGANINDRPCSKETDAGIRTLIDGTVNAEYTVTAVYKNTAGKYWFEVDTGLGQPGYIYSGNCIYYPNYNDVACNGSVPTSVPLNGPLPLSGSITSIGTKLQKITVTLYQENGNKFGSITRDATENHKIDLSTISFTGFSAQKPMKLTAKAVVNVAHYNINTEQYPTGSTRTFDLGTVQLTCVNHTYGNWTLTTPCTCTVNGEWTRSCTICGHKDTKPDEAPGHNWTIFNSSGMTCTNPGYTNYSCLTCGERKSDNKQVTWSGWSTEYPDTSLDRIETKTQYRYRDWTSAGQTTQTGYVDYVESWPDGFDYNNSYRTTTFAQRPKTAYENSTERLVVESDNVVGYLYWHWCRGQQLGLNYNRSISNGYTDTYWCFHAYYSTTYVEYNGSANAWSAGNYDCCQDSYWYFQLPVRRQTYRIESKTGTDGAWGSWSSWSETPVTASSTRQVETRNLYRYINSGLANHNWGTPVRTKEPTNTSEGELTYTCTVCGNKKIEILPKLQFRECSHSNKTLHGKVDPTCTEAGYSGDEVCSTCGELVKQGTVVAATGHTEVTVKGKAATCTKSGKTDGKKCSVCGTVTVAQKTIKAKGHTYTDDKDATCNVCGAEREIAVKSVPMYRMYDPNSGEHFYSGSELERDFLVEAGWQYEGVGFNFPVEGDPVYRLYDPVHGEHLYTMDEAEKNKLLDEGWQYEGVAFNSAGTDEVPQYRLHNPNAKRGGYHFTGSDVERDFLISLGWILQGIGWYSCVD